VFCWWQTIVRVQTRVQLDVKSSNSGDSDEKELEEELF